jgi:preprotein translocase subunit YajC
VIVGVIAWMLLAVPVRRRQRAHGAMQDAVVVGDEIITAGGIHAVVHEAGEFELRVELAPNVVVTLDRRAVAAVAQELPPDPDGSPARDPDEPQGGLQAPAS